MRTDVPRPGAASVADVLSTFEHSLARAKTLLEGMDDTDLSSPWRLVYGDRTVAEMPRGMLLRTLMLNRLYHHRGQLSIYLRLTGASVPAIYGASADEPPSFG